MQLAARFVRLLESTVPWRPRSTYHLVDLIRIISFGGSRSTDPLFEQVVREPFRRVQSRKAVQCTRILSSIVVLDVTNQ